MARRPFPDPTKADLAIVTMVYQDYFFLKKWYDYYSDLFGAEHLYIISHGNDPEHRRIAPDANIIGIHRDPTLFRLDRRRWDAMNRMCNGLLFYYNWLICTDVDEIVITDPDKSSNLKQYVEDLNQNGRCPKSLCPLGLEIIHNPTIEPSTLSENTPILSQRRVFRVNANYSKPCMLRAPMKFTIGGHANTHLPRELGDDLFLIHLRFFDYDHSQERLKLRRAMRTAMNEANNSENETGAWAKDLKNLEGLSKRVPEEETIDFPEFRQKMIDGQKLLHNDKVAFWGGGRTKTVYRLPERFSSIF